MMEKAILRVTVAEVLETPNVIAPLCDQKPRGARRSG